MQPVRVSLITPALSKKQMKKEINLFSDTDLLVFKLRGNVPVFYFETK